MKISIKIIHWTPRILCILSILFISMFAADAFESGDTIRQQLASLFIHLIPSFILTTLLIIAWKWEFIGGVCVLLIGLGMSPFIFMPNYNRNHLSISQSLGIIMMIYFPFVIVGCLLIISHYIKKNDSHFFLNLN